ncbi:MAG: lantibiotic dehydratase [Dyadobacter sp.]|uniref:lantibiotic dehydratase n=1 Tax=Dyadobacter sp. TaxID=1914288 RepID=UPI003266BA01
MINHLGFYLIRRPARSIDQLNKFHQQRADRSSEELLMGYYMGDLLLREAILIASPSLYERMQRWLAGEKITEKQQLLVTLYKYFIRTTTRCTPFGLFSSSTIGNIQSGSGVLLLPFEAPAKKISVDIELIPAISKWLTTCSVVRKQLKLFPNTSLYPTGNANYRYIEYIHHNTQNQYFISALDDSEALSLILDRSKSGATIPELVLALAAHGNACEESLEFVDLLIENQILEFEIGPQVVDGDHFLKLISQVSLLENTANIVANLRGMQQVLERKTDLPAIHTALDLELKSIGITPEKPNILKVDSYFSPGKNQLDDAVVKEISEMIGKAMVLNQSRLPEDIQKFKERFLKKFHDREVPLALALDDDTGVGYGQGSAPAPGYAPMIDDLGLQTGKQPTSVHDSWWQQFIIEKYSQALRKGQKELILTDQDLEMIGAQKQKMPMLRDAGSFFVFGNIIAESDRELDGGQFLFNILACQGPSAVNMLCRFADGIPGLEEKLHACTSEEERMHPDVVFAEIVHYPDSKAGNILTRPHLYSYQIPYLGHASVPGDFQILLSDLMVSVRNGDIVLRSKRLNKRIIPRLSSMHNFRKGVPVYRFLCDLQDQDANLNMTWDWGILQKQAYLPRISYQKLIINRESWLLQGQDFRDKDNADVNAAIRELGLPENFTVASGDNELLINTSVAESIDLLLEICRKNETVRIMEFLGAAENCWVTNGQERFVSEFVFPFQNPDVAPIPGFSLPAYDIPEQHFAYGSEWLFLKIYTSEKSNESPLISVLYPLICKLLEDQIIQQFFFVRYNDPDPHFRLRFWGDPATKFYQQVWEAVHDAVAPLLQAGTIHDIQTDTYCRELERYDWNHIALYEKLFQVDTLDTMHFLAGCNRDENERFLFSIKKIDKLLSDADYSLSQRHALIEKLKEGFFDEFKGDPALRKKLNVRYRHSKTEIQQLLQTHETDRDGEQRLLLKQLPKEDKKRETILSSLAHMTVNRIFPSKQRVYELMLYHCLFKHYDSVVARNRQSNESLSGSPKAIFSI